MGLVIFFPNSDHCPQRAVYSFVNCNFKDFDLCREDFAQNRLKIFYINADTLLDKQSEPRLILEASCYDVVVITEVLPNQFFIWMVTSCFGILIFMKLLEAFQFM